MIRIIVLSLTLVICLSQQANAQFFEGWLKSYNSTDASASSQQEYIYNCAVDDSGNIYTTGMKETGGLLNDIITIKSDRNGNKLWQRVYPDGKFIKYAGLSTDKWGNVIVSGFKGESILTLKYDRYGNFLGEMIYSDWGLCKAYSNQVDDDGNIYVSGGIENISTCRDYNVLIKYSSDRNLIWVKKYEFTDCIDDNHLSKIVMDKAKKVVYQIGFYTDSDRRYLLMKYSDTGALIWAKVIEDVISEFFWYDNINIVYDQNSYIYLAVNALEGKNHTSLHDYATIKMDTNGNQLWRKFYTRDTFSEDYPFSISSDTKSNVYVTGNAGTVKYNSSGEQIWNSGSEKSDIKTDSSDNFYLSGQNPQHDISLVKYNGSGILQWTKSFTGHTNEYNIGNKIIFDKQNNIIVAGASQNEFSKYKNTVLKYDPSGHLIFASLSGNNKDESNCMALSQSNNVYVAGISSSDLIGKDFVVMKYSTNGNREWVRNYNSDSIGPTSGDVPHDIQVSNSENIYVVGESYGGLDNMQDVTVIKYSLNGDQQWIRKFNGTSNEDDVALNAVMDSLENIYVSGFTTDNVMGKNFLIVKYSSSGDELWNVTHEGNGNGDDWLNSISFDKSGNVIATGTSFNSQNNYDIITTKYSSTGELIWQNTFDGANDDRAVYVKTDYAGNVIVSGSSENTDNNFDFITLKYDSSGVQKWTKRFNGGGNGDDLVSTLSVDDSGNAYVSGTSYGTSLTHDYLIIKYDKSGSQEWIYQFNGGGDDIITSAQLDEIKNLYVTGHSRNENNNFDYCTIVLDSAGTQKYLNRFNGTVDKDDYAFDLAVSKYPQTDGYQYVFFTGTSYGNGSSNDIVTGSFQRYVSTIDITSSSNSIPETYSLSQNFPNPFNPKTVINYQLHSEGLVSLKVYDMNGKEIESLVSGKQNPGVYTVEWSAVNFSSGIYFYTLITGDFSETKRMVLIK